MKLIEAMKRVKANKAKVTDLQQRIQKVAANLSQETPLYGPDTSRLIQEWLQSCTDTAQENVHLLVAIARTNLATQVAISLDGQSVTKSIAEWVWRRREYAELDLLTWGQLGDRGLRESVIAGSTGVPIENKIVRHYDPVMRDRKLATYRSEPHEIDATLEVINATTELLSDG